MEELSTLDEEAAGEEAADKEVADEEVQKEAAEDEPEEAGVTGDEAAEHQEVEETDAEAGQPSKAESGINATAPSRVYHPLLIHIAEGRLLASERSARVLSGLRDFARIERKRGRPIILVITCNGTDSYMGGVELNTLKRKGGIASFATFKLEYVDVPAELKKRAGSDTTISAKLVKDLKFLLLSKARQHFDSEILLPHTKWDLQFDKNMKNLEGQGNHLLQTIAAQIVGRALDKPKLELADIAHVLLQVSQARELEKEVKSEYDDTTGTTESSFTDVEPPAVVITDKYERNLASSLVKAGASSNKQEA